MSANIPPVVQRTVIQHIDTFRGLLTSIDASARAGLNSFWRDIRQSLNDQDALIASLQQQISQLQQNQQQPVIVLQAPNRPNTSDSVDVIRRTVEQALTNEALAANDASVTIEALVELDPGFAQDFLKRQKNVLITNAHELGCWMSGNVASNKDYVKINMRGTKDPRTGENFKINPYGHQIAVVAGGRGSELRLTTDGTAYHVSHLCHNGACFNPEHVIVETADDNKKRNECHHSFILRTLDGTMINPCVHWKLGRRMFCILPTRAITPPMRGQYVDMTTEGPILRTGRSNQ